MLTNDYKKSSFCTHYDGICIAVKRDKDHIIFQDTKRPNDALRFTQKEWDAFIKGVKNGEFDIG